MQTYSKEELKHMPMIDIAQHILLDEKEALHFKKMFEQIAEIKGFTKDQQTELIAQFYTDLNIDGRFITTGDNLWGLKRWYHADQIDDLIEEFDEVDNKVNDEDDEDFAEVEEEEFPTYRDDDDL